MDTENYTAYLHLYNWTRGERHASESNRWCWQDTSNVLCVTMQLWPTVCLPHCTVEYVQNIQTFSAKVEELCLHAQRSKSLPFLSSEKPLGLGPCATVKSRHRQMWKSCLTDSAGPLQRHRVSFGLLSNFWYVCLHTYMYLFFCHTSPVKASATYGYQLGQRSMLPTVFIRSRSHGSLMFHQSMAPLSDRFHCSIYWILLPLCM